MPVQQKIKLSFPYGLDNLVIPKTSQRLKLRVQKYLILNEFGQRYLYLLKIFLFLTICRLYFIYINKFPISIIKIGNKLLKLLAKAFQNFFHYQC